MPSSDMAITSVHDLDFNVYKRQEYKFSFKRVCYGIEANLSVISSLKW